MSNEVDNTIKSVQVGTVDFFGILLPGLLAVIVYIAGVFIPLLLLILNIAGVPFPDIKLDTSIVVFISIVLVVFSYVFGYTLRLSSPDVLDKVSARHAIMHELDRISEKGGEKLKGLTRIFALNVTTRKWLGPLARKSLQKGLEKFKKFVEEDGWPYNPDEAMDKYPYFHFHDYLEKRGRTDLLPLATWGPDDKVGKDSAITKRSKAAINEMKINIRMYCPELYGLVESKEGHIRLMAGTWAAFKLSIWPVFLTMLLTIAVAILAPKQNWGYVYSFINLNLLALMLYSNQRIVKLFHYRRVSELFHIVQAAHIAKQKEESK